MKKILIIDDSTFQQKILTSIVQEAGYKALVAGNGQIGFALAEKERPDLVLADLLMPEYDGFYFLEQVQASRLGIPVLVVTSDIQNSTREKCMSLGAAGFINKPVKKELLLPIIAAGISGGRV